MKIIVPSVTVQNVIVSSELMATVTTCRVQNPVCAAPGEAVPYKWVAKYATDTFPIALYK